MRRRDCDDNCEDLEVALDTASSSRPHVLRSSGSTCDSSCCKLCQPTSSTDFQQARKLTTVSAYSRASSWSTATIDCHQSPSASQKAGITGGHLEQHVIEATAVSGGSLASSQSGQGMHLDGDLRELDSRKRRAREHSATEAEAADDLVTVERADLSQSHASSSNLILQDSVEFPKRRCIVQPANSEDGSCGDQTGLDSVREGMPSWQWRSEWEVQEEPIAASFREVAAFERPPCTLYKKHHADIVCSVEFSPDGHMLASAGVAKQIRVYPLAGIRDGDCDPEPVSAAFIHRLPSKMSSVAWSPFDEGVLTVGDYDGVVAQVHIASGHLIADVDEHAGRRVWSVAHSTLQPHLCASGSDDGTARLWAGRGLANAAGVITLPRRAAICGVSFCSDDEHALALAGADCCAYLFDMRNTSSPLQVLEGHRRPVSFARFMGRDRLVTASVDSSVALWSLNGGASPTLFRCYRGHANHKNFVGLSVRARDELIACGSESGAAFAYHRAWSKPVAQHSLSDSPLQAQLGCEAAGKLLASVDLQQQEQHERPILARMSGGNTVENQAGATSSKGVPTVAHEFASAVCWWPGELEPLGAGCGGPVLAAARSNGDLKLLTLVNTC